MLRAHVGSISLGDFLLGAGEGLVRYQILVDRSPHNVPMQVAQDFAAQARNQLSEVLKVFLDAICLEFADEGNPAKCLLGGIWGWA